MRAEPEPHAHRGAADERGDRQAGLPDPGLQESLSKNPYAPPQAKVVDPARQVGEVWRDGKLVRMDRKGTLPDRCVLCNASAEGFRQARKLYWSPIAWRASLWAIALALLIVGGALNPPLAQLIFWPVVFVLYLVHSLVRKRLDVEVGLCPRHRGTPSLQRIFIVFGVIAAVVALGVVAEAPAIGALALLLVIGALLVLAIFGSVGGVRAISVARLSDAHVWLRRTGKPFLAALPPLPK